MQQVTKPEENYTFSSLVKCDVLAYMCIGRDTQYFLSIFCGRLQIFLKSLMIHISVHIFGSVQHFNVYYHVLKIFPQVPKVGNISQKKQSFPLLRLSKQQMSSKQDGILFQVCANVHIVHQHSRENPNISQQKHPLFFCQAECPKSSFFYLQYRSRAGVISQMPTKFHAAFGSLEQLPSVLKDYSQTCQTLAFLAQMFQILTASVSKAK